MCFLIIYERGLVRSADPGIVSLGVVDAATAVARHGAGGALAFNSRT